MGLLKVRLCALRNSLATVAIACCAPHSALAQVTAEYCGPLIEPLQYGPYDYRIDKDKLPIVEIAHFTPQVEGLVRGVSTFQLGVDLNYVLQRFPNHHRALVSVLRLVERKQVVTMGLVRPPECYFERALRWRKDDVVARMLYAKFLASQARKPEAIHQLEVTATFAQENPMTHRNIGLLLIEMKEFELALAHAHTLQLLDPADSRLRDQLTRAGRWREPLTAPTPAAAQSVSAAEPAVAPASAPAASPASAPSN